MKKEFESVEIEVILFSTDVITTSPIVGGDDPVASAVNIGI